MKRFPFLFIFLFILPAPLCFAQKQISAADTNYIETLIDSCKALRETGKTNNALIIGKDALLLIEQSLNTPDEKINTRLKLKKATLLRAIGNSYKDLYDLPNALESYQQCLKTAKEVNDKINIAGSLLNIGVVYQSMLDYQKALDYLNQSVKAFQEIGHKKGLALCFSNLGVVYSYLSEDSLSMEFYQESLNMYNELNDKNSEADQLNNISAIYMKQKKYADALENYEFSLKMYEEIGDSSGIATSLACIGNIYETSDKNLKKAEQFYVRALAIARKYNLAMTKQILNSLKELYHQQARYKEAYEMYDQFILIKDSIVKQENVDEILRREMKSDFTEKQAKLQAEKEKQEIIAEEKSNKQKIIIWSVIGGLILVVVFSIFMFNRWRVTQKQKVIIEEKNIHIEEQKKLVEEKNKDITDSINYAKRIQRAMLPHRKDIWTAFPQSFVLFKPKDIVSGDFYFFHKNNQSVFIASADCTGHGVPGAFMSMIGSGKLNDAVAESSNTSEILSLLNNGIKSALKQSEADESATRDGMDIALCSVDTDNRVVKYAGANRPIWIIRNGQTVVEEIKATKKAIGGFTEDSQHFHSHEIKFGKGDTFYISTDGFADTFGGKEQKKVTTKRFKEILLSIQDKTMKEQEKHLDNFIEDWKSGTEQIDDILVIGVRL